jgi:hypothetical protein
MRKSENGITQKATAILRLETRLSQVRNWGGVYALECRSRTENILAPKNHKPNTVRQNTPANAA